MSHSRASTRYFSLSSDSSPYGPLLAIIALMLWSMFGSLAPAIGMATAAELSHARRPDEEEAVTLPEPPEQERSPALAGDPPARRSEAEP